MKKHYESPTIEMVEIKVERGFAVSAQCGVQQFRYEVDANDSGNVENTAW